MGPSGHLNATRCGLWSAEMLKAREQYREAAAVYFRICNEVGCKYLDTNMKNIFASKLFSYHFFLKFLGTFTFSCHAWASILLLPVIQTSFDTQIWISSCSLWRSLQKNGSSMYISLSKYLTSNAEWLIFQRFIKRATGICLLRLTMLFVHIEMQLLFLKELNGATSKIMYISIWDSEFLFLFFKLQNIF